jgi:hypothetical protein
LKKDEKDSIPVNKSAKLYLKSYLNGTDQYFELEDFCNLNSLEEVEEIKDFIRGLSLKKDLNELYCKSGWNLTKSTCLKDFEISFLNSVSQKMSKTHFTKTNLQDLLSKKDDLNYLENQIINNRDVFNLLDSICLNFTDKDLLKFCYHRSGKTKNDVAFGDGELLITLFTNAKKGNCKGDVSFPVAGKVEIKASRGRVGKPARDFYYKTNIKNFLLKQQKSLFSKAEINNDTEIKNKKQEIIFFLESNVCSSVFDSENFLKMLKEKVLNLELLKLNQFKRRIPKKTKIYKRSLDSVLTEFKTAKYFKSGFDINNIENKKKFQQIYNQICKMIKWFKAKKRTVNTFEKTGGAFIKSFFLEDFDLSVDETAEAFTLCVQHLDDPKFIKNEIVNFLFRDNNFKKLKSGNTLVLEAIIFALQLYSYSKHNFNYMLLTNKDTYSCLSFDCTPSEKLFSSLIEKYLTLKHNEIINFLIQIDSRGGSQISLTV